jgi:hypothetical protein
MADDTGDRIMLRANRKTCHKQTNAAFVEKEWDNITTESELFLWDLQIKTPYYMLIYFLTDDIEFISAKKSIEITDIIGIKQRLYFLPLSSIKWTTFKEWRSLIYCAVTKTFFFPFQKHPLWGIRNAFKAWVSICAICYSTTIQLCNGFVARIMSC